jgi:hypothetical protein
VNNKKIKCFVVPDLVSFCDLEFGELITEDHISKIPQYPISEKMGTEAEELFALVRANVGKRIVFVEESEAGVPMSLQDAIEKAIRQTQFNRK